MAYQISTEYEAYEISGSGISDGDYEDNKCVTYARAIDENIFNCEVDTSIGSYTSNLLVRVVDLSYVAPTYYTFTITFDKNYTVGTGYNSLPSTITKTTTDTNPVMGDIGSTCPTRDGYTFMGWSASSSYSSERIAYSSSTPYGGSTDRNGVSATITDSSWTYAVYCSYTGGSTSSNTLNLYALWQGSDVGIGGNISRGSFSSSLSVYVGDTIASGTILGTITANTGYDLPTSVTLSTGSATIDSSGNVILSSAITAPVTITVTATCEGLEFTDYIYYQANLTNASGRPLPTDETTVTYPYTAWETTVTSGTPLAYRTLILDRNYTGSPAAPQTRVSATFNGWAESTSGDVVYSAGDSITVGSDYVASDQTKTLYANWTYNSTTLITPTLSGYTFLGWYTASSGGTRVGGGGSSYFPTATTTTLYAHWEEVPTETEYTITFDGNGIATCSYTLTVSEGSTITMPSPEDILTYDESSHAFSGWSLDDAYSSLSDYLLYIEGDDFSGEDSNGNTLSGIDLNYTIYAIFEDMYQIDICTVTFTTSSGGTLGSSSSTASSSYTVNNVTPGEYVQCYAYPNTGYYVSSVSNGTTNTNAVSTTALITSNTVNSNITVIVTFAPVTTSISFYNTETSSTIYGTGITYGSTPSSVSFTLPTKSGYTLTGWYSASSGGVLVYTNTGTIVDNNGYMLNGVWKYTGSSLTLYPQWQTNSSSSPSLTITNFVSNPDSIGSTYGFRLVESTSDMYSTYGGSGYLFVSTNQGLKGTNAIARIYFTSSNCTSSNTATATFYIYSYAESSYDYTYVVSSSNSSLTYTNSTTRSKQGSRVEVTVTATGDVSDAYLTIYYHKDYSGDYNYDSGYIGFSSSNAPSSYDEELVQNEINFILNYSDTWSSKIGYGSSATVRFVNYWELTEYFVAGTYSLSQAGDTLTQYSPFAKTIILVYSGSGSLVYSSTVTGEVDSSNTITLN